MADKSPTRDELVRARIANGLDAKQAEDCQRRQDEADEQAEAEAEAAAKKSAKK